MTARQEAGPGAAAGVRLSDESASPKRDEPTPVGAWSAFAALAPAAGPAGPEAASLGENAAPEDAQNCGTRTAHSRPDPADFPASSSKATAAAGVRPLERLRHRRDFLAAARARRQGTPSFLLQARARGDEGPPRVGFTCSRKVGNAVARNRARRRLREAARLVLPAHARPGWDYVLVGRAEATATRPFADLQEDLRRALERVHR